MGAAGIDGCINIGDYFYFGFDSFVLSQGNIILSDITSQSTV